MSGRPKLSIGYDMSPIFGYRCISVSKVRLALPSGGEALVEARVTCDPIRSDDVGPSRARRSAHLREALVEITVRHRLALSRAADSVTGARA